MKQPKKTATVNPKQHLTRQKVSQWAAQRVANKRIKEKEARQISKDTDKKQSKQGPTMSVTWGGQTNEFHLKEAVSMRCRNFCKDLADFEDVTNVFVQKLNKKVKPKGAFYRKRVAVWTLSSFKLDPFSEVRLKGGIYKLIGFSCKSISPRIDIGM